MKPVKGDPKHARSYFMQKLEYTTGPAELEKWIKDKERIAVIDVRRPEHYNEGHVPGAINLPREKWDTFEGLSKDKTNVVYCYSQVCHLAAEACLLFAENGYSVCELEGGFGTWAGMDKPIEKRELAGAGR